MDDTATGERDRRGHWWPKARAEVAPVFVLPPRPRAFLRWLPSYFLPWNLAFLAIAGLFWWALTPSWDRLVAMGPGTFTILLLRNVAAVALFYGALEWRLYVRRRQGTRFKYNPAFPDDRANPAFWWNSQSRDNAARTFLFALPIWTAWEAAILWGFAIDAVPMGSWAENPWRLAPIALLVPFVHHVHFCLVHRL